MTTSPKRAATKITKASKKSASNLTAAKSAAAKKSLIKNGPAILPLIEIFCGHSDALIKAANDCKKTHGTKNIRESGRPLEKAVQKLFNNSIPPAYIALSGYIFRNATFLLSNQIDFLLCDNAQTLRFPPSETLDESYVAQQSVRCFGQIKSSATPTLIKAALAQHTETFKFYNTDNVPSFIIFGLGSKDKISSFLAGYTGPLPTVILCLEDGGIFTSDDPMDRIEYYSCQKLTDKKDIRGAGLMYLYCTLFKRMEFEVIPPFIKSLTSLLIKYPFSPTK